MREPFMDTTNDGYYEPNMVRCNLCSNHVWVREDRLEKHIGKIHAPMAPSKKSFTTYHARLVSSFPPKVIRLPKTSRTDGLPAGTMNSHFIGLGNIMLISRTGSRSGGGRCSECDLERSSIWHYSESNRGPVDICSTCKPNVFERSFGNSKVGLIKTANPK
jgi:hypothetical protein